MNAVAEKVFYTDSEQGKGTDFPHAPDGWSTAVAKEKAENFGITMGPDHWDIVMCLQEYFTKNEVPNRRELNDALEEYCHHHGGLKGLYKLFPGGPISQGCPIAGIDAPAGSTDSSFGSVV
jgi:tRNA 2-thiouridine synthesizing protein E